MKNFVIKLIMLCLAVLIFLPGCKEDAESPLQKDVTERHSLCPQVVMGQFSDEVRSRLDQVGGMDPDKTYKLIRKIKTVLNKGDAEEFAALITYPQTVCLNDSWVVVENQEDMAELFPVILDIEFRKEIINEPIDDLFVNWKGAFLSHGSIWFSDEKITQLNNRLPSDPLSAVKLYKKKGRKTIPPLRGAALNLVIKDLLKIPYSLSKNSDSILKKRDDSFVDYQLYQADLNNDGNTDYILTYINSGSMGGSGVEKVYSVENGKIVIIPYFDIISKSLNFVDWSHFSLHLSSPFIYAKDGQVYHGFGDDEFYNWKGQTFRLLK